VLAEVGTEAGLDADEVRRFLDGEEGAAETDADLATGQALGIDGVPFFLFEGRYGVMGAQPAEALVDIIEQVVELEGKRQANSAAVTVGAMGEACTLDE
jgi:predicted DsbA family dithiol-disulfide isomerase